MAAVTGLTMVKRFTYRADTLEEFGHTYHFRNTPPPDAASWNQLSLDVWAAEQLIYPPTVHWVRAYGYDSDDPKAPHVWTVDKTVPGPPPAGTSAAPGQKMAGDQAAMVWWKTARLNARGKPIYLRKYIHSGGVDVNNPDLLSGGYITLLGAYIANASPGVGGVYGGLRSRSHDETIVARGVSQYTTTRTLKRRGKRPRTAS